MIVVVDTSPINYLVLVGEIDVLHGLFGRIAIPETVQRELATPGAPAAVRRWIQAPPNWLAIQADPPTLDGIPGDLHAGERAALGLARAMSAELLVIDETDGRQAARKLGIQVIGTLGVLELADVRGLTSLTRAMTKLEATSFRASPRILARFRDRQQQRAGRRE